MFHVYALFVVRFGNVSNGAQSLSWLSALQIELNVNVRVRAILLTFVCALFGQARRGATLRKCAE